MAAALSARGGQSAARSGAHMDVSIMLELMLAPELVIVHDDGVEGLASSKKA